MSSSVEITKYGMYSHERDLEVEKIVENAKRKYDKLEDQINYAEKELEILSKKFGEANDSVVITNVTVDLEESHYPEE